MAAGSEVKRLQVIYEVNDKQFVDGMNRMKAASQGANAAIRGETQKAEVANKDLGTSAKRAADEVVVANDNIAKAAQKSSAVVQTSIQQIIDANIRQSQSSKSAEESFQAMSAEMSRIEAKYDPAARAAREYEQAVEAINLAHRQGAITSAQQIAATNRLNTAFTRTGSIMGVLRRNAQNVSYQVQDMAVQFAMGTNAAIVMGQQMPQLLSGFGPLGAAMGLVAAIGFPLIAMFTRFGSEAESLQDKLDRLSEAVDAYTEAAANARLTTEELEEKYGDAAGAAQVFLEALKEIQGTATLEELNKRATEVVDKFGELRDANLELLESFREGATALDPLAQVELNKTIRDLRLLSGMLEIGEEEAFRMTEAMQALDNAEGPQQHTEAYSNLVQLMQEILPSQEKMTSNQKAIYDEIVRSGLEAAELSKQMEIAELSIANLASIVGQIDFSTPLSGAQGLAALLGNMVTNASTLLSQLGQAATTSQQSQLGVEYGNPLDPLGAFGGSGRASSDYIQTAYGGTLATPEVFVPLDDRPKASGSKGRGGSSKAKQDAFDYLELLKEEIELLEREAQVMNLGTEAAAAQEAEWRALDAVKREGIPLTDEMREKIRAQAEEFGRLTAQLEQAEIQQDEFNERIEEISETLTDIVFESESFADAMKGIFEQLARDLFQSGIKEALTSIFNVGQSGGGGIFGSILGILGMGGDPLGGALRNAGLPAINSYEGGGFTGFGERSGGFDGRGGRFALVHPNETITDHSKPTASNGPRSLHVDVSGARGNTEIMDMVRQGVTQGLREYDEALPGRVREVSADNNQRYG